MSSISSMSSKAPLPNSQAFTVQAQAIAPSTGASTVPVPPPVLASDEAKVISGEAMLSRVATTSLWSSTFELPSQPAPPPSSKKPWDWESTPDITANYAGGASPASRIAVESLDDDEEEEEDWNFFDFVSTPFRAIGDGLQQGAKAIDTGVNAVVGAIGDAASNAWKAITSIRLW